MLTASAWTQTQEALGWAHSEAVTNKNIILSEQKKKVAGHRARSMRLNEPYLHYIHV